MSETQERCCRTCRYWTPPRAGKKLGSCKSHNGHYGAKVPFAGGYAMIDTFDQPDTPPTHLCEAFAQGVQQ